MLPCDGVTFEPSLVTDENRHTMLKLITFHGVADKSQ